MKRLAKILAWTAGVIVILLVVAVVLLKLFFPTERVRALAVEKGSAALGRPVTIEGLDLSFWGGLGVELSGVRVNSPEGFPDSALMTADNVDVKLRLLPLLSGDYRVNRLIIGHPRIHLRKLADGSNNFTFERLDSVAAVTAPSVPKEGRPAAVAISFDELEIVDGYLSYVDDSSGYSLALDGFNLSTALANPQENLYSSDGKLAVRKLGVTAGEPYPEYSVGLDYSVQVDLNADQVVVSRADVMINDLELAASGSIAHFTENPSGTISINSKEVAVAQLLSLLPPSSRQSLTDFEVDGRFSVSMDLQYDAGRDDPMRYAGTASINDFTMRHAGVPGDLSLRRALLDVEPDNLRVSIEDGSFDGKPLKGYLVVTDFNDPRVNGELAGQFDLVFVEPFLPVDSTRHLFNHKASGHTQFDLKFAGPIENYEAMEFSGSITVKDGSYSSAFLPEPIQSFSLDMYFDRSVVNIRNLATTWPSGNLTFTGRVDQLVSYLLADSIQARSTRPEVDGKLNGHIDLKLVNVFLPPQGNPELSGAADIDFALVGRLNNLNSFRPRGRMTVTNATYTDSLLPEPVESFDADMAIVPDTIRFRRFDVRFSTSDVSFTGVLVRPFPYLLPFGDVDRTTMRKPLLTFKLTSNRFDVDRLFPQAVPGAAEEGSGAAVDSVSMVIIPDIQGQGTIAVDTLIYSEIEFTSLKGDVSLDDRRIRCYNVTTAVYSGEATGETTIDLNDFNDPRYVGQFKASEIEADDFVTRFTPFGGHLFGKINVNGTYDARGWEPEQFLNSLSMNGKGSMNEGKVVTSGAAYKALNGLADLLQTEFSEEQPLRNFNSGFTVDKGRVRLDKLVTRLGGIGDVTLDGYYSFDGKVDYTGSLLLSEERSKKLASGSGVGSVLAGLFKSDKNQRLQLPLSITETITSPKVSIDYSKLTEQLGKNALEGASDALKGLLKKKD